jgi:DNA-binding NarL/FixJ family response regulator
MRRRAIATVLVGPSTLMRDGLACILCAPRFRIVASAVSLQEMNLEVLGQYESRLLVIEASDQPRSAIESIEAFKQHAPLGRVALLANRWRADAIVSAFKAGANVYFPPGVAREEFTKAIELVMLGQTILPMELLAWSSGVAPEAEGEQVEFSAEAKTAYRFGELRKGGSHLSARERAILCCIARGASNKLIAREIGISEATVKVHVKTILHKVGVCNRTQAAIWAMSNGGQAKLPSPYQQEAASPTPFGPKWQNGSSPLPLPNGHSEGAHVIALAGAALAKNAGDPDM